jgi:hypothetical protein
MKFIASRSWSASSIGTRVTIVSKSTLRIVLLVRANFFLDFPAEAELGQQLACERSEALFLKDEDDLPNFLTNRHRCTLD